MAEFDESILEETKKALGIAADDTSFDVDVKMHINSAFGTLSQLGLGPDGGFEIEDEEAKWTDFLAEDLELSPVKSYVYLRVKMLFDPPATSWTNTAFKQQIEELEWRLNVRREDLIPIEDAPLPDEDMQFELDGGVI